MAKSQKSFTNLPYSGFYKYFTVATATSAICLLCYFAVTASIYYRTKDSPTNDIIHSVSS